MNAFRFRLAKVLSWRQTQLALQEADLERLRSDLRTIETAIAALGRRDEAATGRMRKMQSASGSDIAEIARFRAWVAREEKALRARSVECGRQIAIRSQAVTEARRQVELVERMKERRRESWDAEFNLELDQLAGESALSVWRREKGQSRRSANASED